MSLHSLPEIEVRDNCKRAIEGLELWLRRLIHDKLSAAYGANYINATRQDSSRVIRAELARTLTERQTNDPKRYPRPIDAALLDDEISIICNPALYKPHFEDALITAFPLGNDSARVILDRLVAPRNAFYHANAVSVHDAYRVLCYTLDIVEAFAPPTLERVILPRKSTGRAAITYRLNLEACGIHLASLFPGIDGLANSVSWLYKWGRLPPI